MKKMFLFVKTKQKSGQRQFICLGGLAGNPFRNDVGILGSELLCELSKSVRIQYKIVDGRISVTVHSISEDFSVSADSCDMPSIRC